MKILYDLSAAQPYKSVIYSGGGNYAFSLLEKIMSLQKNVEVFLNEERDESEEINKYLSEKNIKVHIISSLKDIEKLINTGAFQVVIFPVSFPDYAHLSLDPNQKIVTVIHDLSSFLEIQERNTEGRFSVLVMRDWLRYFKANILKKYFLKTSKRQHQRLLKMTNNQIVITVSNYSRETILGINKEIAPENVLVAYPTISSHSIETNDDGIFKKLSIEKGKYFLLVSGDRWTKNNYIAIKALYQMLSRSDIMSKLSEMKIVVVGNSPTSTRKYSRLTNNDDHFIYLEYVGQMELNQLFKHCHALIYPTLIEGFGLPPFEVLKFGNLSLCSSNTSLPDIYENSVIYFNPYDIYSIKVAIRKSFDKDLRSSLSLNQKSKYERIKFRQEKDTIMIISYILDQE